MTQSVAHSITDLRLMMRETIYNNSEFIGLLLENIERHLDCTSISFDEDKMEVNIKIKKTAMKKAENYSHSVMYYYPLICNALVSFFSDARIRDELKEQDNETDDSECPTTYKQVVANILCLFNATTLMDNVIVIQL